MSSEPLLEVAGMEVVYRGKSGPVLALDGVSLAIESGEMVGVIGESGSGKTTLARAIVGLLGRRAHVGGGEIRFGGELVYAPGRDRLGALRGDRIGMVFQHAAGSLDPVAKIGAQLREVLRAHRDVSRAEARRTSFALLERLGFDEPGRVLDSYPFQLSGGMAQRVAIAAATITQPDIVIADECTSALDVTTQAEVVEVFRSLADRAKWSLVFVTHDILLAAELCSRLVVMYAGQIVEDGSVRQVVDSPRHPYTRALIDAVPLWRPRSALRGIDGSPPQVSPGARGCRFAPRCPSRVDACVLDDVDWTAGADAHGFRCIRPVGSVPLPSAAAPGR
jgi:oligopeptide/dipeptide ABC transporter ATP-binding protein